jgi:hypothetical protein
VFHAVTPLSREVFTARAGVRILVIVVTGAGSRPLLEF